MQKAGGALVRGEVANFSGGNYRKPCGNVRDFLVGRQAHRFLERTGEWVKPVGCPGEKSKEERS